MEIAARDQDHTASQYLFIYIIDVNHSTKTLHIQITITNNRTDPGIDIFIILNQGAKVRRKKGEQTFDKIKIQIKQR